MPQFCNPLILLQLENCVLADLTPERIRVAEQNLLGELAINGQQTVPYHGHPLAETAALAAVQLLENPAQRQLFQRLMQEQDLHNFLHGSWSVSFGAMANSSLWYHPILRDPLKMYMQPALAASLVQALQLRQQRRTLEIITLIEATPTLEALVCYAPAQAWLELQSAMLDRVVLEQSTAAYAQRARAIRIDLLDGKAYEAKTLNCLPAYQFRTRLDVLGLSLTDLARRVFPAEPLFAIKTFSTARLLEVEQAVHVQIEGIYTSTAGKWEPPIQEVEPVQPAPPPPRQKPPPKPKPKPTLQWQPQQQNPYAPPPYTPPPQVSWWDSADWKVISRIGVFLMFLIVRAATCSDSNAPTYRKPYDYNYREEPQILAYWDSMRTANDIPVSDTALEVVEDKPVSKSPQPVSKEQEIAYNTLKRPFDDCLPVRAIPDNAKNVFYLYGDPQWDAVVFLYTGLTVYDHFYLPKGKMTKVNYRSGALITCYVIFGKKWSETGKSPCGTAGYFRSVGKSYEALIGRSVMKVVDKEYHILLDAAGPDPWESLSDQQVFQRIKRYH